MKTLSEDKKNYKILTKYQILKIWNKTNIDINGQIVEAIEPVIISASRATDIPAFYPIEFIQNLQKGYCFWTNPFNNKRTYISFKKTKLIVFWSKNPKPLLPFLRIIDDLQIDYFFQFTLNDYEEELFEPNLPSLNERIETFIQLSEIVSKNKIFWRFDPLILSKNLSIFDLIQKIEKIGNKIITHTNKLIFSFVDINNYLKIKKRIIKNNFDIREFEEFEKEEFARNIEYLQTNWQKKNSNFQVTSCAEDIDLENYNIKHNKCIDNQYITNQFKENKNLIEFVKKYGKKDKNQRKNCQCIVSKDIGKYNTCQHNCIYCYANK